MNTIDPKPTGIDIIKRKFRLIAMATYTLVGLVLLAVVWLTWHSIQIPQVAKDTATQNSRMQAPTTPIQETPQPAVAFIAYENYAPGRPGVIEEPAAEMVNLPSGKVFYKKDIVLPDGTAESGNPIQLDPKTGYIYVLTDGVVHGAMGGCGNKDGSCSTRIYRVDPNTGEGKKIFQTDDFVDYPQWVLNPDQRQILIIKPATDSTGRHTITFVNIDTLAQKDVSYVNTADPKDLDTVNSVPIQNPALGPDTRYAYAGGDVTYAFGRKFTEFIFDFKTQSYTEKQLPSFETEDGVGINFSPDGELYSYSGSPVMYTGTTNPVEGYSSDHTKSLGQLLGWSGMGHWLMYHNGTKLTYYDPTTQATQVLPSYVNPIDETELAAKDGYAILSHTDFYLRAYSWENGTPTPLGDFGSDFGVQIFPKTAIGFQLDSLNTNK